MSNSRSHFYSALTGGLVVAVVMAMLPATAATGDVAKMGQWNRAGTQTVFTAAAGTTLQVRNTRTTGIPLRLIGDASMPPMQVSSDVLVANLNADLLDGMGASAFAADGHPHAWADLTSGIPADLADGDDDTVYTDPEAVAAVLAADGTESGLDADLLDGHDTGYFAIDGHGHTVTDLSDVTLTSIGVGELLRWTGTAWVNATLSEAGIAAAIHNHAWSDLTSGIPAGLADGDDDTLGGLSCPTGQIAKMTESGWDCADDDGSSDADTLDGLDSTDFLGASAQATDSAALGGDPASSFFGGGAVVDAAGLPLLGATCLLNGGYLLALAQDGSPYCSPAGGTGLYADSGQTLGTNASWNLALGDLDGDGDLDAYVANESQPNRVWINNGNGVFTDSGQALGTAASHGVALGDLDGDGDLDAYAANGAITIGQANRAYFNDGAGVFTDGGQAMGDQYRRSRDVALGDLDGDGDLDVFVVNDSQTANRVWLNDGAGAFTDSQGLGNSSSRGVGLGDLDGDGDLDAFVVNDDHAKRVWLNDGTGSFTDSGQVLTSSNSRGVALGDLDGNGSLDAFVADSGQANRVWFNG